MNKITIQLQKRIDEFMALVAAGAEKLQQAGVILVELIKDEPQAIDLIVERYPTKTSRALLEKLEAVGRGTLKVHFLLDPSPVSRRIQHFIPDSETQEKVLEHGLGIVDRESGRTITKPISAITSAEALQIIAPGGDIRNPTEQKAYIAQREMDEKRWDSRYCINENGTVTFYEATTFDWSELNQVLDRIKPDPATIKQAIEYNRFKSK